jgi:predicted ferric reductase
MTAIDLSSFAGLTAMVLLTLNILLGTLVSRNYNPAKRWPHRKIPLFKIHNWTAYIALAVVLLHPTLLLFAEKPKFGVGDILLPVSSPGQTAYNNLGALAFYSILVVVVTSYFRPRLGSRPWKKIHYTAYFAGAMLFTHGLLIDPELKNRPPDLIDGEKVLIEVCCVAVCAAGVWRYRQKRKLV